MVEQQSIICLPLESVLLDKSSELPDYDFSKTPLDARELADLYYKEGFKEVEAKVGVVRTF